MGTMKINSFSPLSLAEVKEILEHSGKDSELNYRAGKTLEYVNHFVKISPDKARELREKLKGLNLARLKDEHIVKLIDFLPRNVDDFRVLFQGSYTTFPKEDIEAIIKVINEVMPEEEKE